MSAASAFCATDFGTSDSAIAVAAAGAARGAALRPRLRWLQPSSTAAIATPVASTLPVFSPATHRRPERTR